MTPTPGHSVLDSSASAASNGSGSDKVARFSISIPCELAAELDRLVDKRGFKNRSQAVAEMVLHELAAQKEQDGTESMAGTLSLVYDYRKRNLQNALSELQHTHYLKIVASMHVHLEHHHYLEVLLVQGPAADLRVMADAFATCKGVKSAKLQLTAFSIPPLL